MASTHAELQKFVHVCLSRVKLYFLGMERKTTLVELNEQESNQFVK